MVAYSRLAAEAATSMPEEALKKVVCSLIELAAPQTAGFNFASTIEKSTEELLMDGAVDQTFAFNRTSFIQLTGAKVEQSDKLA